MKKEIEENSKAKLDTIGYKTPDFPVLWHYDTVYGDSNTGSYTNWHKEIEFLYFTEGEAIVLCNANEYHVNPGTLVAIYPYALHRVINKGYYCKFHCLIVDSKFISSNAFWQKSSSISITNDKTCINAVSQIIEDLKFAEELPKELFIGQFMALTARICNENQTTSKTPSEDIKFSAIRDAIKYIHENYENEITIKEICGVAHMSKSYFSDSFKKTTGKSFIDYLNLVRCERAHSLLSMNNISIQECANLCGYNNISYFCQKFKSLYNVSPASIRKKNR